MNAPTEEELWARISEGDSVARETVILKFAGLVKYVVDRLSMTPPSTVEYGDLYNCGVLGLISAVDRFDATRGVKFQTYAVCRIRGEILDESKRMGWVPRPLYKKNMRIERTTGEMAKKLGRHPDEAELASELSMEIDELRKLLADYSRASLASLYDIVQGEDSDGPVHLIDLLGDPDVDITAPVEREEIDQLIAQEIDRLPKQEKTVVALYYKDGLTFKEIGKLLGVTESRISQIHSKCMLRIRSKLRIALE